MVGKNSSLRNIQSPAFGISPDGFFSSKNTEGVFGLVHFRLNLCLELYILRYNSFLDLKRTIIKYLQYDEVLTCIRFFNANQAYRSYMLLYTLNLLNWHFKKLLLQACVYRNVLINRIDYWCLHVTTLKSSYRRHRFESFIHFHCRMFSSPMIYRRQKLTSTINSTSNISWYWPILSTFILSVRIAEKWEASCSTLSRY